MKRLAVKSQVNVNGVPPKLLTYVCFVFVCVCLSAFVCVFVSVCVCFCGFLCLFVCVGGCGCVCVCVWGGGGQTLL